MKRIETTGIVLDIENIDTDQIIPAKFLKSTDRAGFGVHLFSNWRYNADGSPKEDFAFNAFEKGSAVLIAGNNFGCGSSREHAAWALSDYGIRAIISSQFADIFKGNALNNDIVPIVVKPNELEIIKDQVQRNPQSEITVDIESQSIRIDDGEFTFQKSFEIDPLKKKFIMEDISELEYLISIKNEVAAFEEIHVI